VTRACASSTERFSVASLSSAPFCASACSSRLALAISISRNSRWYFFHGRLKSWSIIHANDTSNATLDHKNHALRLRTL
jgi:hypothetical protein